MTKFLQDLLGNDHPLFSTNIQQLERATGGAGIDARLIGDITEKAHTIMRHLKLDPADTTGQELYSALRNIVRSGQIDAMLTESDYVLINLGDGPVSLNQQDVIENAHHELDYAHRTVAHAQRHLRMEIVKRYADHDRTDNQLVHKLTEEIDVKRHTDESYPVVEKNANPEGPSILAVGDIFTDAFIMLSEDSARIDTDEDGSKRLSLPYGAKPSYDHVDIIKSVGPSPNVAISCARLGLNVSLMAWLGDDVPGRESLEHLHSEHVNTSMMITEPGMKSSYWYVLRYQSDRTMLVKSEKYTYEFRAPEKAPDWLYLSYIGEDSWPLHEQLVSYVAEHPEVKLVFQPGTYHFKWGVEKLKDVYRHSYLTVMNREEAMDVTGKPHDNLHDLAQGLHELGPEIVVITDGPNGSYASHDGKLLTIPNYPDPAPPFDRTGAGDAFASTIVATLAQGESLETALLWAPINSMSVVQKLGAQEGLLTKAQIQEWLNKAPDNYKVTEMQ